MREIIFRGMKETGEWEYGSLIDMDGQTDQVYISERFPYASSFTNQQLTAMNMRKVDRETIGQYTGLKDCNGKMIFEGDIVKITDHTIEETFESCGDLVTMLMTRTYEVFWNATKWSIKSLEPMLAVDPPIFDLPTNHVTYEIIGNIHNQKE